MNIRYCAEGQWHENRQEGEVVILMIAFIEDGMRIPMGLMTRDYLRVHRLAPTQCASNMFRILGCVDALNDRMGLGLTHHDVNWVYNLHHLKGQGYYLKSRYPEVRLIQCLPESNKGLNKDFLIMSGEWHDSLHCPTREGQPSGILGLRCLLMLFHFLLLLLLFLDFFFIFFYYYFLLIRDFLFVSGNFADRHAAKPNFDLVNKESLDKMLQAEVFVHDDGQL